MVIAAAEIGGGAGMIDGGSATMAVGVVGLAAGGTGSVAIAGGAITMGVGVGMVSHGGVMLVNAADNLNNQKGRVNTDGQSNQSSGKGRGKNNRTRDDNAQGDHSVMNENGHTTYNNRNSLNLGSNSTNHTITGERMPNNRLIYRDLSTTIDQVGLQIKLKRLR
jgi:hypothetical protein